MPKLNKRTKTRSTRENTYCVLGETGPQYEVVEISADGFSFACDHEDTFLVENTKLPDISIVNGEAHELIHAAGVVRHRSSFDARLDRIGVVFLSKRFDNSVVGKVRLPRRRPAVELGVTLTVGAKRHRGSVIDYNVRSARLALDESVTANPGDPVGISIGTESRSLYNGAAVVVRSEHESVDLVVEFLDNLLELRTIWTNEKAMFTREIIEDHQSELSKYSLVSPQYKALILDWQMFLEKVEQVLDAEEAKDRMMTPEDEKRFLDEVLPPVVEQMRLYIGILNGIEASIELENVLLHKRLLRSRLERFIRRSPLGSSIMDKMHGYHGDFETVKQFFAPAYVGPSLFGKLMNGFIMSLEPVTAHVNRISFLEQQLVAHYEAFDRGIRILSLGAGPAEEILGLLRHANMDKPIHVALIDQDAHALADFYERVQPLLLPNVDIQLVNFNIVNILVGKTTNLEPQSYDITYCAGMFDYFKDRFCRKFIEFLIDLTRVGGHFIYTNVHKRNFGRYFMDYGGGWEIYHRDEQETQKLAPADQETEVLTEETGTNVFVKGTRVAPTN